MYQSSNQKREYHLGALLILAVLCAQCIPTGSRVRAVKAAWNFVQLGAYPALVFLFGSLSREWADTRERLLRFAMGFFELYLVQKMLLYWVAAAVGEIPNLLIFQAEGGSWLYLVMGEYLLVLLALENTPWPRKRILAVSLAVGCLTGLAGWIGNSFALSRMLVYLPLFLMGRWDERPKREALLRRWPVKAAALAAAALTLGLCWWKADYVRRLAGFFAGNKGYSAVSTGLIGHFGIIIRLGWYVGVTVLTLALLALTPRLAPAALTNWCGNWIMAYTWHVPLAALMSSAGFELICARLGKQGYFAGMGLVLALGMLSLLPWAVRPVRWLLRRANFWNPPDPETRLDDGKERPCLGACCVFAFTCVFLVLAAAVTLPFFQNGKSMIWDVDGLHQQYTSMAYLRTYLVGAVQHLLSTGTLRLPQFTFQAGMGMDVLDVIRRDPVLLLCALVPKQHLEGTYAVLGMLRIYLSGLAFILLCLELKRTGRTEIVCGATSFAFCGFSMYILIRQPVFQTPCLIYLPLMLAGVERFLHKRKGGLFLLTVCLNFISGYYLAYMNTLLMALYLLIRLLFLHGSDWKTTVTEILRLIGYYAWGVALSGAILFPTIYSYLTCGRTGEQIEASSLLFYSKGYYETLINELVKGCPQYGNKWAMLSFAGLTLLAIVLLLLQKDRQFRPLKVGVLLCTVMICVPLFGKIMNGFGYVTNRWCYGFALVGSLVLVYLLPEFLHLNRQEKLALLLTGGVYLALVLASDRQIHASRYVGLLMLTVTLLVVVTLDLTAANHHQKKVLLSLTLVLTLMVNLTTTFLPEIGDYASVCLNAGEAWQRVESSAVAAADQIHDESFYRVEQPSGRSNQALALDYYGTTSYFSVTPMGLTEAYLDFNLNTAAQSFDLRGLDARASLETLSSVKYYLTERKRVPYGFQKIDEAEGYRIYENQYALPLGYAYPTYMTESKYDTLNFAEKQQAVLQCAVVPDESAPTNLEEGTPRLSVHEETCRVEKLDGVTIDEETGLICVADGGGSITLSFDSAPDCESYLYLEGIRFANPNSGALADLTLHANHATTRVRLHGPHQVYYYPTSGYSFNMGYSEEGYSTATLTFLEGGDYACDAFRVLSLPMADYAADAAARGAQSMKNVTEDGDHVTGTISLRERQLLSFTIPYTRGWTLYVDGQPTPLVQVNKVFMGAVVEAGEHDIELCYEMPWLRPGLISSAVALLALLLRAAVHTALRRRPRSHRER